MGGNPPIASSTKSNTEIKYLNRNGGHDMRLQVVKEKVQFWIAWKMPRWLVYFCSVRLMAHATQGENGDTVVPELTAMDALKRWGKSSPEPEVSDWWWCKNYKKWVYSPGEKPFGDCTPSTLNIIRKRNEHF